MVMKERCQKSKLYDIWQSSNMKLFGVQRQRKATKLLQFLGLMKTMSDWQKHKATQLVSVRHHEKKSLNPRKMIS
jgi:hypothetical protein